MYVTRPLSLYRNNPSSLSLPTPEGPNSGYLVLQDDESMPTYFFGLFKDKEVRDFPFPQNKLLEVVHGSKSKNRSASHYPVYLIPAINQPLSSNIYYAIKPKRRHKGEGYASSREEDNVSFCFCNCIQDVKPRPLDPADVYQQFKFSTYQDCWGNLVFSATSVASDGYPPSFLRRKATRITTETPKNFSLGEAAGLDPGLRARLPDFNFPLSYQASNPVVVGKWYCPFMFIKDLTPKDQVKKSMFYEMTLEQIWEQIFSYEANDVQGNNTVNVDTIVPTETIRVAGEYCVQDYESNNVSKMVLFKSIEGGRDQPSVGLSSLVYERMIWEEERAGWVTNENKQDKVLRTEEYRGMNTWTRFGCYMLVERFVLKRMDGSNVLTYDFNHTHQIRSKWE